MLLNKPIIILILTTIFQGDAFYYAVIPKETIRTELFITSVDQPNGVQTITGVQNRLGTLIAPTNRGRDATPSQRKEIDTLLSSIEQQCPFAAPARSPLGEGTWTVQYTDAPPPSNGKLGIFDGVAQQQVSGLTSTENCYRNILRVPPNDWLVANLDALWEEWDGVLIEDTNPGSWKTPGTGMEEVEVVNVSSFDSKNDNNGNENLLNKLGAMFSRSITPNNVSPDYGASNWLVTFQSLSIKFLGVQLFEKKFDATQRVWRTTYVDDQTRIVRAGRTGRKEDELVFYMTRAKDSDVA